MARHTLSPDEMLRVSLDALISRNQFTSDPGPVLAELREVAGDRTDLLAEAAGLWAGFQLDHVYTRALTAALKEIEGTGPWVLVGEERARRPVHGTHGFPDPNR